MTIKTRLERSRVNYKDIIEWVFLHDDISDISLSLEPSLGTTSVEAWIQKLRTKEQQLCTIDCPGFSTPYQTKTLAGRSTIVQHLSSVVGTINVYLPLDQDTVLWASASSLDGGRVMAEPTARTKAQLIRILDTLRFDN